MAVTATPIFAQAPRYGGVFVNTANTNRDGTGTIFTVLTAGANGSVIDHIDICATGTTTAGVLRFYTYDGATNILWKELLVAAITPSTTVTAFMRTIDCSRPANGLYLPSGYTLRASTHNAESFAVHAYGYNF